MASRREWWKKDFWLAPVDGASLAVFRILFGLMMAVSLIRFAWMGWIERSFVDVQMVLKYPGFEWVPHPGVPGIHFLFVAALLASVAMTLGWRFRWAVAVFFTAFTWIELIDASNYLNHYYLVSLLSLIQFFLPMARTWSLDASTGRESPGSAVPFFAVALIRFQFCVVYFFAGLAKTTPDWLFHGQPMSLWMTANVDLPLVGPLMVQPWTHLAASWAGFLYDSLIWIFLLIPATRGAAYGVVLLFHGMTHLMFPIGLFPFIMTLGTLIFFSPSWPRDLLKGVFPSLGVWRPVAGVQSASSRWASVVIGFFVLFQIAFPLRSYVLYRGDINWTEEGMRWSWRVMTREKNGHVDYRVLDPSSGREWIVPATDYLARHQEMELSGQPDLILQLAHRIRDDFQSRNMDVEVRAEAIISLNGRAPALFIDPTVDLAKVVDSWRPKSWILPTPEESPVRLGRRQ